MTSISKLPPTQRILCFALDDLVKNRSIDDILTKDIYEGAGLSANTFYYHFKDKYDCASLLVKIYECRLHKQYRGSAHDFFHYIASGAFISGNLSGGDTPQEAYAGLDNLLLCLNKEFEKISYSVPFWRKNAHIWKNILSSEAQNSPMNEHEEAWLSLYKLVFCDAVWLNSMEINYLAGLLLQNHQIFWKTSILTDNFSSADIDDAAYICNRVSFAIYDIAISEDKDKKPR